MSGGAGGSGLGPIMGLAGMLPDYYFGLGQQQSMYPYGYGAYQNMYPYGWQQMQGQTVAPPPLRKAKPMVPHCAYCGGRREDDATSCKNCGAHEIKMKPKGV